jgi:photosystem II stability/assembly factor-like uncharacterized protein
MANTCFGQQWKELGPCGSATYGNSVASQGGTGQIHCITFDPDNTSIVYCGSPFGGLWKSTDGGKSWSCRDIDVNQDMELSSVCDIAIVKKKESKTIWVATGHPGARGYSLIALEPYTCGLYTSEDGGKSFKPVKSFNDKLHFHLKDNKHISRIAVHPKNPDIIFVATSDGLYRTTNGGKNWVLVLTEEELPASNSYCKGIFNVKFSVNDPDHSVYACGNDIYRSIKKGDKGSFKSMTHHGGDMFEEQTGCFKYLNFNIDINKETGQNTDYIYALGYVQGDTCGEFKGRSGLVMYSNEGKGWLRIKNIPTSSLIDGIRLKIASVPGAPRIIYMGAVTTFLSSDYGKTWRQATDYNQPGHADIHAVEIIPGTNDMITGTDGGIFRYHYSTNKVEEYNTGLCVTAVNDMSASASNPNKILIGNDDTGSDMWDGSEWHKLPTGGDGYAGQLINRENEHMFFTCANFDYFKNDKTDGILLKPVYSCGSHVSACPCFILQSPTQQHVFYYASKELYKSVDDGNTWCRISDFTQTPGLYFNPSGHAISTVECAPADSNVIYVAFNAMPGCCNSFLFKTDKGGMACSTPCGTPTGNNNWKYLPNTPKIETGDSHQDFIENGGFYITTIAVSDNNPDHVWIGYAPIQLNNMPFRVYKSTDGGETWVADEKGLPQLPCTKLVYMKGSNDELFMGTWNGVYYKQGTDPWKKFGTGFPKVFVRSLEINYKARKLRAATFGRGVWEADIP